MKLLEFRTLGIIVTYKCNIECADCCFSCNPRRKERFTLAEIIQLIDEATELGSRSIVFTGGEPTLLGRDLEEAIRHATSKGNQTRMVTNGWWGKTREMARNHIARWQECGLGTINISVDDFHQSFVPIERIKNASEAGQDLGVDIIIGCTEVKGSKITADSMAAYLPGAVSYGSDSAARQRSNGLVSLVRAPVLPFGEGANVVNEDNIAYYEGMDDRIKGGCPMVLESPAIHPDGRVTACCGLFTSEMKDLDIGRWPEQSLKEILTAGEDDVLLNWIRFEGLTAIRDFIKSKDSKVRFLDHYANVCHLCGDIFKREETRRIVHDNLDSLRDRVLMSKLKTLTRRISDSSVVVTPA